LKSLSNFVGNILIAILPLLVLSSFSYLVFLEMLFFRLRRKHPEYYKAIGEPSLFLNNSISKSGEMYRFVMDRDYLDVPDERAIRLGNLSRRLLVGGLTLFVIALLLFATLAVTLR